MRLTHVGHACVLVEMAGSRLVIDPGTFVDDLSGLRDLDAVLVTHQHPDHLDQHRLPALLADNPRARVLADP
ncbi:MAG: MBL fold metallo-hydrolase, partial [Phycicoccus sp.]